MDTVAVPTTAGHQSWPSAALNDELDLVVPVLLGIGCRHTLLYVTPEHPQQGDEI
jgi:hypothetical protein